MATALLATGASRLICPHPLYHMLARQFSAEPGRVVSASTKGEPGL